MIFVEQNRVPLDDLQIGERYGYRYEPSLGGPAINERIGTLFRIDRVYNGLNRPESIHYNFINVIRTRINYPVPHDVVYQTHGHSILGIYRIDDVPTVSYGAPAAGGKKSRRKSTRNRRLKSRRSRRSKRSKKTRRGRRPIRRRRSMRGG
jgi:hypothetical protein